MLKENSGKYADIINLPHHVSKTRKHMSMKERSFQFAPFAALVGYDAAIKETGRLTQEQQDLDEDRKVELDARLQILAGSLAQKNPAYASITWFRPDDHKEGGAYITTTGYARKIDPLTRILVLEEEGQEETPENLRDQLRIPIENIYEILLQGELEEFE